jgi:hypothetical protein
MTGVLTWPGFAILLLGIGHGVNPGMGWLFAVALGLQEQERRAVWRALLPLAAGHALAIAAALAAALLIGRIVPPVVLKWVVGIVLIAFGITRLLRHRHPRFGGMRVNARELTWWSFLMASAHGAGLMVLPFALGHMSGANQAADLLGGHAAHAGLATAGVDSIVALLAHTGGYLLATGLAAVIVYEKLGLRFLRTLWLNIDLVWGVALVLTGLVGVVM